MTFTPPATHGTVLREPAAPGPARAAAPGPGRASGPGGASGLLPLEAACELLRALGTPHRLAIVLELADGPRCVHELVEALGASQSLTSQHLRVLRTGRLVVATRRGRESVYSLADEHVAHIARDALTHGTEGAAGPAALHPFIPDPTTRAEEHPA